MTDKLQLVKLKRYLQRERRLWNKMRESPNSSWEHGAFHALDDALAHMRKLAGRDAKGKGR